LLEVSQHVFGQWIIKVIGYDERTCREAERSWSRHGLDRTYFRDRPIMLRDNKSLAPENAMEDSFGISLHLFDADVHDRPSLTNI
jgi:hypothetical protein